MPTELPEVYNDLSTPIIPVITINETIEVNVTQGHHFIAEEVANVRVEIQDVDSDEEEQEDMDYVANGEEVVNDDDEDDEMRFRATVTDSPSTKLVKRKAWFRRTIRAV